MITGICVMMDVRPSGSASLLLHLLFTQHCLIWRRGRSTQAAITMQPSMTGTGSSSMTGARGGSSISAMRPRSAAATSSHIHARACSLHGQTFGGGSLASDAALWPTGIRPASSSGSALFRVSAFAQSMENVPGNQISGSGSSHATIQPAISSVSALTHVRNLHTTSSFGASGTVKTAAAWSQSIAAASIAAPPATTAPLPSYPITAGHAAIASSAPVPNPNASLIAQIEDQWHEYMQAVAAESNKAGPGSAATPPSSTSIAALSSLLSQLHINALPNFFEYTQQRQILSIWGPSFDCLYFKAPSSAAYGQAIPSIYRDRTDYIHTMANIQTLVFRCVDFQLLQLHLPLIRQRMTKLRHLILSNNNLHALWQLDALAMLAPCAASTGTGVNSFPASHLESVSIDHNSVCELPLYRSYLISILCINALQLPPHPSSSILASQSPPAPVATGVSPISQLDGESVSDEEVLEAWHAFGALHRAKYCMLPSSSTTYHHSKWIEVLWELSIAQAGGLSALGTAANPLSFFPWHAAIPSPSCHPLPLRPVSSSSNARKNAKKLVDELCNAAIASTHCRRQFESSWEEMVGGAGGAIDSWLEEMQRAPIIKSDENAVNDETRGSSLTIPSTLHPSPSSTTLAHQQLYRLAMDKTKLMKLFNSSSYPTAQIAAQQQIQANVAIQKKKKLMMQ